jgi:hypothetical protein
MRAHLQRVLIAISTLAALFLTAGGSVNVR